MTLKQTRFELGLLIIYTFVIILNLYLVEKKYKVTGVTFNSGRENTCYGM